jgi:hypothetical protein
MYICFGNKSQIKKLEICRNNSDVLYKCIVDDFKMVTMVVDHTFQMYNVIVTLNLNLKYEIAIFSKLVFVDLDV